MRRQIGSVRTRVVVAFGLAIAVMVASTPDRLHAGKGPRNAAKRTSKLDVELNRELNGDGEQFVRVIVKPARGRHEAALKKHRAHGHHIGSEFKSVNAFAMTVHAKELRALQDDPDVDSVSADAIVKSDAVVEEASVLPSQLLAALRGPLPAWSRSGVVATMTAMASANTTNTRVLRERIWRLMMLSLRLQLGYRQAARQQMSAP